VITQAIFLRREGGKCCTCGVCARDRRGKPAKEGHKDCAPGPFCGPDSEKGNRHGQRKAG
jgi:hypothetical protein